MFKTFFLKVRSELNRRIDEVLITFVQGLSSSMNTLIDNDSFLIRNKLVTKFSSQFSDLKCIKSIFDEDGAKNSFRIEFIAKLAIELFLKVNTALKLKKRVK